MPPITNNQAPQHHQTPHITRKPNGVLRMQRWLGKPAIGRMASSYKNDVPAILLPKRCACYPPVEGGHACDGKQSGVPAHAEPLCDNIKPRD